MSRYEEQFVLDEYQASKYIIFYLNKMELWENICFKKCRDLPEWIFSGYIKYHGEYQKIIKILNKNQFIRLLRLGIEEQKKIKINYIEFFDSKNARFTIKYNLVDKITLARRRY